MRRLRVGVVGCGRIARTAHIPNYLRCPDAELVAVADKHRARAEQCSRQFGVPLSFDSFEGMLETADLDALSICVPNKFHAPYAIAALERGCHVLCEKPPAMTGGEAAAMAASASRAGRVLTFGFHYRSAAEAQTVKRFVDAGELGEIQVARAVALRRRGIPGWGVFPDKAMQGGGPLMDIGVHVLDLALWLMGYPRAQTLLAAAYQGPGTREGPGILGPWDWRNYSVEDIACGMIRFEGGASLLLETSFAADIGEREQIQVSLIGDQGEADVLPPRIYQERHGVLTDTTPAGLASLGVEASYRSEINSFVRCCLDGEEPPITAAEAVALQRIIDALYLSASRQQPISLADPGMASYGTAYAGRVTVNDAM